MLVRTPLGEPGKIGENLVRVGVEDMRPILVDEDSGIVEAVIGVAADVRAPVDQQDVGVVLARQPLGENRAGEARADDQIIIFARTLPDDRGGGVFCRGGVDQPRHPGGGRVPAQVGELEIDRAQPVAGPALELQRALAGGDELSGRVGDEHAFQIAIVADDVGDPGRDHRAAAGEIFRRLGG